MRRGFLLSDSTRASSGGWGSETLTRGWGTPVEETQGGQDGGSTRSRSNSSQRSDEMGLLRDPRSMPSTWGSAPQQRQPAPSRSEPNQELTLKGLPFMPSKTAGTPKAPLAKLYSQAPRSIQISEDQYETWDDAGPPHERRFTSVFICPITGEVFATEQYGSGDEQKKGREKFVVKPGENAVWCNTKKLAEHGAAARAFDCLSARDCAGTRKIPVRLGKEDPYMSDEEAPPLPILPPGVQAKIALVKWFAQQPRSIVISKDQFQVWNDGGEPSMRRFTALFCWPQNGEVEVWPSGRVGNDPDIYTVDHEGTSGADVVWYPTEQLAKQAAAARAIDCLQAREFDGSEEPPARFGKDEPYMIAEAGPRLPVWPPEIQENIEELKRRELERMQVEAAEVDLEEAVNYREEYRSERFGANSNEADLQNQVDMEMET